jgi:predicted MPP superfamily phosphohydrolase
MQLFPTTKIGRRRFCAILATAAATGGYAWGIEPRRLELTRQTLVCPRLPGALDGLRVAVLSDIHYDPDWQEQAVRNAIAAANAENPDLILLPGDFVAEDPRVLETLAPLLGQLRAKHGVFASIGNHDGWRLGPSGVRQLLEKQGIGFLCNQSTRLNLAGQRLDVVGTDSIWSGFLDPARAFAGTRPETTLALVHEPDPFEALGARSILQVSGHTHGGQCRVPFVGYAPVGVRYGRKFIYGDFQQTDGGRLFVSRGLGTIGMRVRFACIPEVAILELRASR